MFTYEQFKKKVVAEFGDYFTKSDSNFKFVSCEAVGVTLNNGVKQEEFKINLMTSSGAYALTPYLHCEDAYEDYRSIEDFDVLMEGLVSYINMHSKTIPLSNNPQKFTDTNFILENCFVKLINTSVNEELLEKAPHTDMMDMSITYRVRVNELDANDDGISSYLVSNEILKSSGLSLEIVHEKAMENTRKMFPPRVSDLSEVMRDILSIPEEFAMIELPDTGVKILSNETGNLGASVILYDDILEQVSEIMGGDFYVLPSSIHECLAAPVNMMEPGELTEIVTMANVETVAPNDQLSNQVYMYDSKSKSLSCVTDSITLKESHEQTKTFNIKL